MYPTFFHTPRDLRQSGPTTIGAVVRVAKADGRIWVRPAGAVG